MENEELLQRAQFGHQIELFWGSRVGEYLAGRVKEVYTAASEELMTVDPEDTKRIRHLQNEVFKARSFEAWLSEAVMDGLKSLEILESDQNED